eukprot:TRINITY_DN32975_c0_g1_i1.p1 TRINITY_DN32975_c0_g1~~TRINITY_DN32975_c0_g1_i1.p1  ORF type:complete len:713 (+),score=248.43 TRINITY_DN32975_c0_g1_i1:64-2139(+)
MAVPRGSVVCTLDTGLHVALPQSLTCTSTFVAREQGNWFEDELEFLQRCCQPGWHMVDIGASFGFYSLALAKATGGRCVSFEPHPPTAARLRAGAALNGVGVEVLECAVGATHRQAKQPLAVGSTPELSRIDAAGGGDGCVMVDVVSLDGVAAEGLLPGEVHIMKMDCEGSEQKVLQGGAGFLSRCSPLILWEVSDAGAGLSLHLISDFERLGYRTYRLAPGLQTLRPYGDGEDFSFMLNLFAAKDDTAAALAARGLVNAPSCPELPLAAASSVPWEYCRELRLLWSAPGSVDAFELYASARLAKGGADRVAGLRRALQAFSALAEAEPSNSFHRCSVARCHLDLGERGAALASLQVAVELGAHGAGIAEAFLAPTPAAERVPAHPSSAGVAAWYESALLHAVATVGVWSLAFAGGERSVQAALLRRCVAVGGPLSGDAARRLSAANFLEQELTAAAAQQQPPAPAVHWEEAIDLGDGSTTPGEPAEPALVHAVPSSLAGKRVAVVGARDGRWAFEAVRRGAREVVALKWDAAEQRWPPLPAAADRSARWAAYEVARGRLGIPAGRCRRCDAPSKYLLAKGVLDLGLSADFDVVLCFGWLDAEPHVSSFVEAIRAVTAKGGDVYIDSLCRDTGSAAAMSITDAGWRPSHECFTQMLSRGGFGQVTSCRLQVSGREAEDHRALFFARAGEAV